MAAVVAYAVSPIDLIPDFIPVLGLLDDLLLLPLGIVLALRMIPPAVMAECRARVESSPAVTARLGRIAALVIAVLWIALIGFAIAWGYRAFAR